MIGFPFSLKRISVSLRFLDHPSQSCSVVAISLDIASVYGRLRKQLTEYNKQLLIAFRPIEIDVSPLRFIYMLLPAMLHV